MDRTSASYKMKYGVGKTAEDKLLEILRNNKFSLNIDEATSDNLQKVLCILVSFLLPKFSQDNCKTSCINQCGKSNS